MHRFAILTFLIACAGAAKFLTEAPSFITPCNLHDSANEKCVKYIIQKIFANLYDGIPGFKHIPKLDPFKIKAIQIKATSPAEVDMEMKDILCTGFSLATVTDTSVTNGNDFKISVNVPNFKINGKYKLKASHSIINIDGGGPYHIDITDLKFTFRLKTKIVEHSGEHFIEPLSITTQMVGLGNINVNFEEIYPGDTEGTEATNDLINAYQDRLNEGFQPVVEKTLDAFLLRYTRKLFSRIPARFLFKDIS